MPDNVASSPKPLNAAQIQAEHQRLAAVQAEQARDAAQAGQAAGVATQVAAGDIGKDVFVAQGRVGTAEQRESLFTRFDTDGRAGLSPTEFDAAMRAFAAEPAVTAAPRPKLPLGPGQKDPTYLAKDPAKLDPVRQLQTDLSRLSGKDGKPYFSYKDGPTGGYFGVTEGAVKAFQQDNGLPATGRVDAATYDAIQAQVAKQGAAADQVKAVEAAKQTIDGASITGTRPSSGSPDRIEEQAQADARTLKAAQDALAKIPAEDPDRARYAKKVEQLQAAHDTKWWSGGAGETMRAAQKTIDTITGAGIDPATRSVNGACYANDAAFKAAVAESVAQVEGALQDLPADDPARKPLEAKVQAYREAARDALLSPEQRVAKAEAALETELARKAGHPVNIVFQAGGLSPQDQLKQLDVLREALADPALDPVWVKYDRIEFNTYTKLRDSGNIRNLSRYTEVSGATLKINNAGNDGLTDVEIGKQAQALRVTARTGKGS